MAFAHCRACGLESEFLSVVFTDYCRSCGHRWNAPLSSCDCPQCVPLLPVPELPALALVPELPALELVPELPTVPTMPDDIKGGRIPSWPPLTSGVAVSGRHFTRPLVRAVAYADEVQLYLDCADNPEEYVKVVIDAETIGRWWREMAEAEENTPLRAEGQ